MEEQIPPSQAPGTPQLPIEPQITPAQLAEMKERARQLAIQQAMAMQGAAPQQQQRVVYVRRNLTVAELLVVLLLSCGIVTGIQAGWNFATNVIPRLEIKLK